MTKKLTKNEIFDNTYDHYDHFMTILWSILSNPLYLSLYLQIIFFSLSSFKIWTRSGPMVTTKEDQTIEMKESKIFIGNWGELAAYLLYDVMHFIIYNFYFLLFIFIVSMTSDYSVKLKKSSFQKIWVIS